MKLSDFDFVLPTELLAEYPAEKRDGSRLMVVDRRSGTIEHRQFSDLAGYFSAGDALVLNNTKVIPARMQVRKNSLKGALIELLLIGEIPDRPMVWDVMLDPMRKLRLGHKLIFGNHELEAEIVDYSGERQRLIQFDFSGRPDELREKLFGLGEPPLPPYIKRQRNDDDRERYQTVYARNSGAVAAPTAGLHFTPEYIAAMKARGILFPEITLHIGMGTFAPIDEEEDFRKHKMHTEIYQVDDMAASVISNCKESENTLCGVGTTVLRTLESIVREKGKLSAHSGSTDLFIYPPYEFNSIDALLTNFHTPRSTLLMLVSAFGGYDLIRHAYQEAIAERYRFFSYGDAMLIL